MNKVVAIVVTYNRLEMLKQCVDAIMKQTIRCDILLVDNCSTDGTKEWVNKFLLPVESNVRYINTGENIGGAGGFNYGLKAAIKGEYSFFWIMDDDCVPKEDALEKLLLAGKRLDIEYGYLSSVVLWKDGKECKMNRQKIKKSYYEFSDLLPYHLIEVEQSTFVSLLIPSTSIHKVGFPIKEFFIWGDDIEFTRRMTVRNKMPCFMVENSIVTHQMIDNNGSSIATDSMKRIDRYKYAFRNEGYLYRKEGVRGMAYYFGKCCLNIWRIIIKANDYKLRRICVVLSGMIKGMFFNPVIELTTE